jgi:hypothetical protein
MEYLYFAEKLAVFTALVFCVTYLLKFKKVIKKYTAETGELKRKLTFNMEEFTDDILEVVENLNGDVTDLHAHVMKLHQDRFSWVNPSKELPTPGRMVLLLTKDKEEVRGFLNENKTSWTIMESGLSRTEMSFEKVVNWKKLFHL